MSYLTLISLVFLAFIQPLSALEVNTRGPKHSYLLSLPEKAYHGPNYWNSSLFYLGFNQSVRFTSSKEFNHIIESKYCRNTSKDNLQKGDLKMFRVNIKGLTSYNAELHTSVWLSPKTLLNKMTVFSTSSYEEINSEKVDSQYGSISPILVFNITDIKGQRKQYRCEKKSCRNKIIYKRCHAYEFLDDISSSSYHSLFKKLQDLEAEISEHLFIHNNKLINDSSKYLSLLEGLSKEAKYISSSDEQWIKVHLGLIIESLAKQLTIKQPNWLKEN